MDMIDLKLPKIKASEKDTCSPCIGHGSEDRWPYGQQLRFENEQVAKLPSLKLYKVGDKISVAGEGVVTEVRSSERQDGESNYTVVIQLQQVGCTAKKELSKMSMKEYRQAREESKK